MDLNEARQEHTRLTGLRDDATRAAAGYEQMIAGLVSIFPELAGKKPAPAVSPAPTAAPAPAPAAKAKTRRKKKTTSPTAAAKTGTAREHVAAVLAEDPETWLTVSEIEYRAKDHGWSTTSADPAKVVYAALSELVKHEGVSTDMHGRSRVYKHK